MLSLDDDADLYGADTGDDEGHGRGGGPRKPGAGGNAKGDLAVEGSSCTEAAYSAGQTMLLEQDINRETGFWHKNEELGEGFDQFGLTWTQPSKERLSDYRDAHIYQHNWDGDHKRPKVVEDAATLSLGVRLYFQLLHSMAWTFFFMFLFSIPLLLLSSQGSRVLPDGFDVLGLYSLTLANVGYTNADTYHEHYCTNTINRDGTGRLVCVEVFGNEMSLGSVSLLLTVCELLQVYVFFRGLYKLRLTFRQMIDEPHPDRRVSVTDYAVMVENLPPDTTTSELVAHFSKVYQLTNKDFRGRLPLEEAVQVTENDNSGDTIFKDTWVVDCRIVRSIGTHLNRAMAMQETQKELLRHRAAMKMFGEDTMRAGGPSPWRRRQSERNMLRCARRLDRLRKTMLKPPNPNAKSFLGNRIIIPSCTLHHCQPATLSPHPRH